MVSASVPEEGHTGDGPVETASQAPEENGQETETPQEPEGVEIPLESMKKAQLIERVEEAKATAEKNRDLYVRSQAEIDNLKKRHQKEQRGLVKFSNESLIKQLLPVADNLEKAVSHALNGDSFEALREGVDLTLKGLMDVLQKAGVEPVKAVGEPFDPNFHEAVSEMADDQVAPGTVLKDLQKGYTLNQRLIRPSMVVVSKKTA